MCGDCFVRPFRFVTKIGALCVLSLLAGSQLFANFMGLGFGRKVAPVEAGVSGADTTTSQVVEVEEEAPQSDISSTVAAGTPIVAEPQPTVSETKLAKSVEAGAKTVKLSQEDARETYQILMDQAESIGALTATIDEKNALLKRLNGWHLDFLAGGNYDFGAEDWGIDAGIEISKGRFGIFSLVEFFPASDVKDPDSENLALHFGGKIRLF
jgi:hypothetical protein